MSKFAIVAVLVGAIGVGGAYLFFDGDQQAVEAESVIQDMAADAPSDLVESTEDAGDAAQIVVETLEGQAEDAVATIKEETEKAVKSATDMAAQAVENVNENLTEQVGDGIENAVGDAVENATGAVTEGVADALQGLVSPSGN